MGEKMSRSSIGTEEWVEVSDSRESKNKEGAPWQKYVVINFASSFSDSG